MTVRKNLTAAAALAALAMATLLSVSQVSAHARYKSSTPDAGAVLTASPAQVEITFTEAIQKVAGTYAIEVIHDRGASVAAGAAVVDDADHTTMSVPLQANLSPGRYVVNWKNTSDDDGDPVNGAFAFYVNRQPNSVDLANDQALAQIGFEDVTASAAAGTPAAATTSTPAPANTLAAGRTTAAGGTQSPASSAATPTATSSSSDNSKTAIYVIIAVIAVIAVVGLGVWQYGVRRRQ